MRIKKKLSQHRRDFTAIFECEHCGYEETMTGYDDKYFHEEVIPSFKCPKCGAGKHENYQPMKTVYPEGYQI